MQNFSGSYKCKARLGGRALQTWVGIWAAQKVDTTEEYRDKDFGESIKGFHLNTVFILNA